MIHVLVRNNQQFIFITVPTEITSTPSKLSRVTQYSLKFYQGRPYTSLSLDFFKKTAYNVNSNRKKEYIRTSILSSKIKRSYKKESILYAGETRPRCYNRMSRIAFGNHYAYKKIGKLNILKPMEVLVKILSKFCLEFFARITLFAL